MMISPTCNSSTPIYHTPSTPSLKPIAEIKTEGLYESLQVAGNSIIRGHSTHAKSFLTSYNADDLSTERMYEGPEGHDDIKVLFADENHIGSYSTCGAGATSYVWNRASGNLIKKTSSSLSFAKKEGSFVVQSYVEQNGKWRMLPSLLNLFDLSFVKTLENADSVLGRPVIEGDSIFCSQQKGIIGCWNRFTGAFVKNIGEERESAHIQSLYVDQNLTIAVESNAIRVSDTNSGKIIKAIVISPKERAYDQELTYKNDLLQIKSFQQMEVWNIKEEKLLYSLAGLQCLSSDEESHFFANERAQIEVRNQVDGRITATLEGHPAYRPIDIKCKSCGNLLVSSSRDGLKIWDKNQGKLIAVLTEEPIDGFVVKNKRIVAQAGNALKMWDLSGA